MKLIGVKETNEFLDEIQQLAFREPALPRELCRRACKRYLEKFVCEFTKLAKKQVPWAAQKMVIMDANQVEQCYSDFEQLLEMDDLSYKALLDTRREENMKLMTLTKSQMSKTTPLPSFGWIALPVV